MSGVFISFEGVDGVGKTTQVERLRAYLESRGCEVVVTREPGGTALGGRLRDLLLNGVDADAADAAADIAARAEALIFAADRAQHVAEVVRPALERGAVVITDRYLDSSLAYQAGGRELTADEIRNLSMWATGSLMPARTYLLDMDPDEAHRRLTHEDDRMESAGDDFRSRTRDAFRHLAGREPKRFRMIDAAYPEETVWARIKADVDALLDDVVADERFAKMAAEAAARKAAAEEAARKAAEEARKAKEVAAAAGDADQSAETTTAGGGQ
ncbi:thymidylate kinase [Bifidobacterium leontopitheci]|uniref:Thymidylate kinase n=1 Tax=Bifidobacterium leontopitheci TaxID=2650774 RepID=A0A6I1GG93_9BIFI|nr:thymidylate kinase [Bifidobacterium leontopitheci]